MALFKGNVGAFFVAAPSLTPQSTTGLDWTSTSQIGQLTDWTLNAGPGVAEVTEMNDTWVERVTTINNFSGSASGFVDIDNITTAQREIFGRLITSGVASTVGAGGTTSMEGLLSAFFLIKSASATTAGFVGNIVPSFEVTGNVGGVFGVSFSFAGAGNLIYDGTIGELG